MNERVARCLILASVIAADGVVHPMEKAFLNHLMSRLGLSPEEQAEVVSLRQVDQAEALAAAMSVPEKRAILDEAVAAVLVDGQLHPAEKEIIDRLSKLLGFQGPTRP
jgi:tellurite resistance protein